MKDDEAMIKTLIFQSMAKPSFGLLTTSSAALLQWFHLISPIIAFTALVFGCLASIYSFLVNRKRNKEMDLELKIKTAQLKKISKNS